jgi:hypothetical protein
MKTLKIALGVFFIICGVLWFVFLRMLNDPEIEGESGRVSLGAYFYSLIPITLGIVILSLQKSNKESN